MLSFSFLIDRATIQANNVAEVKELLPKAYAVNVFAANTDELTGGLVNAIQKFGYITDGVVKMTKKDKPYMTFKQKAITAEDLV